MAHITRDEVERVAAGGFRAILLPAVPPKPYYSREFDPVWAAAEASGVHVFIHTQTGGVKVNDTTATPASTSVTPDREPPKAAPTV